jgi:hypothetical protein
MMVDFYGFGWWSEHIWRPIRETKGIDEFCDEYFLYIGLLNRILSIHLYILHLFLQNNVVIQLIIFIIMKILENIYIIFLKMSKYKPKAQIKVHQRVLKGGSQGRESLSVL